MNSKVCPLDLDPPVRTAPEMKGGQRGSHLAPGTRRASPPGWAPRRAGSRRTGNPGLALQSGPGALSAIVLSVKTHGPRVSRIRQPAKFKETADVRG